MMPLSEKMSLTISSIFGIFTNIFLKNQQIWAEQKKMNSKNSLWEVLKLGF